MGRATLVASAAGLRDELEIHLISVLLGDGRRLFDHLGVDYRELVNS
jgi:dihydrofolate reductase